MDEVPSCNRLLRARFPGRVRHSMYQEAIVGQLCRHRVTSACCRRNLIPRCPEAARNNSNLRTITYGMDTLRLHRSHSNEVRVPHTLRARSLLPSQHPLHSPLAFSTSRSRILCRTALERYLSLRLNMVLLTRTWSGPATCKRAKARGDHSCSLCQCLRRPPGRCRPSHTHHATAVSMGQTTDSIPIRPCNIDSGHDAVRLPRSPLNNSSLFMYWFRLHLPRFGNSTLVL